MIEKVGEADGDHHDSSGDLLFLSDAALDQLGAGLVVGDHVSHGAGVFHRAICQHAGSGNRVAPNQEPEVFKQLHR